MVKNPFPLTATIAVVKNETTATKIALHSSGVSPAIPICETADGARPNPIIIIIGPITTGGNNLSNQFFPVKCIIVANIT